MRLAPIAWMLASSAPRVARGACTDVDADGACDPSDDCPSVFDPAQGSWFEPPASARVPAFGHALADVDGDGLLDLVTWEGDVAWARGDGVTFGAEIRLSATPAEAVLPADLDGDGDVDLVLSDQRWLENLGGAAFLERPLAPRTGHTRHLVADLDADGDLDVIRSPAEGAVVAEYALYEQTAPGELAPARHLAAVPVHRYVPPAAAVGDVDGDGLLDLLAPTSSGLYRASGRGDGTVGEAERIGPPASAVAVADLDGDGLLDLVVTEVDAVRVQRGAGGGAFAAGAALPGYPGEVRIADLDLDGVLDLVTGAVHTTAFRGLGRATFAEAWTTLDPLAAVGDVDADGAPDLVVRDGSAFLWVHRKAAPPPPDSDADGLCDADEACAGEDDALDTDGDGIPNGCDACGSPGDADADGVPDDCDRCPAGPDGADADADALSDGCDACPLDPVDPDTDGVCEAVDPCEGVGPDSDGDGVCDDLDPCRGRGGDDADGDGACDARDRCPGAPDAADADADGAPDGCDPCPRDPRDDRDGDGRCADVDRCARGDDGVDLDADGVPDACDDCSLPDPGQGRIVGDAARATGDWRLGAPASLAIADLDGDGDPDAVVAGRAPALARYEGVDGRLELREHVQLGAVPLFAAAVGDFDGDGDPDVVGASTGLIWPVENRGGTFVPRPSAALSAGPGIVLRDLDHDGLADLIPTVSAWARSRGDGTFDPPIALPAGPVDLDGDGAPDLADPQLLGGSATDRPLDLDGDGDLDLVRGDQWSEDVGGSLSPWVRYPGYPAGYGGDVHPHALGDLDADGDADLLGHRDLNPDTYACQGFGHCGTQLVWLERTAAGFAEPVPVGAATLRGSARPSAALVDLDGDGLLDVVSLPGLPRGPEWRFNGAPIEPDSDGDRTCDADDRCDGADDRADADGDGVPDGCDP